MTPFKATECEYPITVQRSHTSYYRPIEYKDGEWSDALIGDWFGKGFNHRERVDKQGNIAMYREEMTPMYLMEIGLKGLYKMIDQGNIIAKIEKDKEFPYLVISFIIYQ